MNITHLKYAVEIEKSRYLNKAAENLYMAQPNLSKALKDLEDSIGITIFKRTPKGMLVTPDGEEFLEHAKKILREIEEVEDKYTNGKRNKEVFAISVPRATYISYAFSRFAGKVSADKRADLFYKETNSMRAINNILHADFKLGIIRYALNYEQYFEEMVKEKNLCSEDLTHFNYYLAMSKEHPLANKKEIDFDDLSEYIEVAHADPYVPSLSASVVRKEELPDNTKRRIFVFERASQFELLNMTQGTFMWVSPLPDKLLKQYGLVQRQCSCNSKIYKDILIYPNNYKLSKLDKMFISELKATIKDLYGKRPLRLILKGNGEML